MALKNARIPNPSGTAITASTLGLIGGVYANPLLALSGSGVGTDAPTAVSGHRVSGGQDATASGVHAACLDERRAGPTKRMLRSVPYRVFVRPQLRAIFLN